MTSDSALSTQHSALSSTQRSALSFWFGRINYEQRSPSADDLKLDRMRALLRTLGNPEQRLRVIHVAGSKGKGSTSAMLAAILRAAGYRTGLFTSPHLCHVEERVQVDGEPISAAEMTSVLEDIRRVVEPLDGQAASSENGRAAGHASQTAPTFFEIATALGFLHFVRRRVDVAVIEVGLGGRFDATNVCTPEVALITSISFDHTRQLGNRLASIAMEKAGIVKPGRPAVSGATAPEARGVIERICRERRAPLQQLSHDFYYHYEPGQVAPECITQHSALSTQHSSSHSALSTKHFLRRPRVQVTTRQRVWPAMDLGLLGDHQAANAAVAVACVEELRKGTWHIPDQAVADGLAGVCWPARLEVMRHRPLVILDCAHNIASAQALAETLEASASAKRRLLIFASSNDKDVAGIFGVLAPHFAHAFLTRYGSNPRSVPPEELAALLRKSSDLPHTTHPSAADAWRAARAQAAPEDLICVTGSVFLAGELRPLLLEPD